MNSDFLCILQNSLGSADPVRSCSSAPDSTKNEEKKEYQLVKILYWSSIYIQKTNHCLRDLGLSTWSIGGTPSQLYLHLSLKQLKSVLLAHDYMRGSSFPLKFSKACKGCMKVTSLSPVDLLVLVGPWKRIFFSLARNYQKK